MKQVFTTIAAALVVLSAAAQAPGTESTVVGKKLNFEAPLFGVTVKNTKPAWTIVTFGEIDGGMSYSLGTPSQMKPIGVSAELSIVEWRYRPWRNGNIFTWGLSASLQQSSLTTGYVFDEMGEIGPTRESWIAAGSKAVESAFYVPVGYVHEFGKCKAGLFFAKQAYFKGFWTSWQWASMCSFGVVCAGNVVSRRQRAVKKMSADIFTQASGSSSAPDGISCGIL